MWVLGRIPKQSRSGMVGALGTCNKKRTNGASDWLSDWLAECLPENDEALLPHTANSSNLPRNDQVLSLCYPCATARLNDFRNVSTGGNQIIRLRDVTRYTARRWEPQGHRNG